MSATLRMVAVLFVLTCGANADEALKPAGKFARTTIDLGVVVGDIDRSVKFYTEVLGFKELAGFDVPKDFAAKTGLSKSLPFHVHVLVLGEGETATKFKLMQFKTAPGRRSDNRYIHSSYGFSYVTVFVNDLPAALERAKKHKVKPIAAGPSPLPNQPAGGMGLAIVRDPDGNMIELVGPLSAKPK